MPRVKTIPLTPEQVERDGWRLVNKIIQKAMVDKDIRNNEQLSKVVGINARTLRNRFGMMQEWKAGEIFRIVYLLGIEDSEVEKILKLLRGKRE